MSGDLLIRDVLVDGQRVDVAVCDGTIAQVGVGLRPSGDPDVLEGAGGALIPGLHDHHLHLLATAAARSSVPVGPPEVGSAAAFEAALRAADASLPPGAWLRAVGYHESVAGPLDRDRLDAVVPHRPVRVQHRTGAMWVLSSAALDAVAADTGEGPADAERDGAGRLNGRLHRADDWLRDRLGRELPDLAELGRSLAGLGITGVTDATPYRRLTDLDALATAAEDRSLPQRVMVMGGIELAGSDVPAMLQRGPVKVILDEHDLPALDELSDQMRRAHRHGHPVAIHCVTRTSLTFALVAWEAAGASPGDRIEHGSVIPPELVGSIAALGLTVVTQPGFVAERGDQYLTDVDADDLDHLYPCASLLQAGVEVAASSDAPYTSIDPWAAMRSAATRTTRGGQVLGADESVPAAQALLLYLGDPARPGGPPRLVRPGTAADLCLLDGPPPTEVRHLEAGRVVATIIAGRRAT